MQEFFLHLEHGNSVDPKERTLDCHNGNATKKQPFETSTKTPQMRHVWKMSNEKTAWKQNFGIINKRKHHGNKSFELLTRENTSRIEPLILMPYQQRVWYIPS
jgi:hypothetical protein